MAKESAAFQKLADADEKIQFVTKHLDKQLAKTFSSLPHSIQMQLCLDRDPHGNVQVSLIETEKMLAEMAKKQLKEMSAKSKFKGKFSTQTHFLGYEGRCAAPSNYDADYCYSLGYTAAALIGAGRTGYMASVRNTTKPFAKWICGGIPITMMMNIENATAKTSRLFRKHWSNLTVRRSNSSRKIAISGRSAVNTFIPARSSISARTKYATR
jgi:pyrophosphate--fructose-6-phosphate 1-phosphotransferase